MTVPLPLMPGDIYPDYPHIIGAAPVDQPGTAAELFTLAGPRVVGLFTVDAGCVGAAFRQQLAFLNGYISVGGSILFLCQNRRGRAEAAQRLQRIVPADFPVRL